MSDASLRDAPYPKVLAHGSVTFPSGMEGRIERLRFKEGVDAGLECIRFSWWKDGRLVPRPLDSTEDQLLELLKDSLQEGVFTQIFLAKLRHFLKSNQFGGTGSAPDRPRD